MTVRDYFEAKFPAHYYDLDADIGDGETLGDILAEMPTDSNCGDDCVAAIDAAAAMVDVVKRAFAEDFPDYIAQVLDSAVQTCSCFIRG